MKKYVTGSRLVTLVDDQGKPTGSCDIFEAHQHPTQLHAAASVWVFSQDQVLLQQRSSQKILAANCWANTVCGNVKPDETPLECAYRRLQDEINFTKNATLLEPSFTFRYKAYGNQKFSEHEFDHVFVGTLAKSDTKLPQPNPEEVQATSWVSFTELQNWAKNLDFPSVSQSLKLDEQQLEKQTKPQLFSYQENEYLIAPWTIFMLRDNRLISPSQPKPKE